MSEGRTTNGVAAGRPAVQMCRGYSYGSRARMYHEQIVDAMADVVMNWDLQYLLVLDGLCHFVYCDSDCQDGQSMEWWFCRVDTISEVFASHVGVTVGCKVSSERSETATNDNVFHVTDRRYCTLDVCWNICTLSFGMGIDSLVEMDESGRRKLFLSIFHEI